MDSARRDRSGSAGPSAPHITTKDLLRQAWVDACGKEVQTAATYSYTWLADQFGHVCLGILAAFIGTWIAGWTIDGYRAFSNGAGWREIVSAALDAPFAEGRGWGLALAICGAALWEWNAYRTSVKNATGTFPLDSKLLRANAIIAAAYIALGAILGFAFHNKAIWALLITLAVVVAAVLLAPPWLRQKIIWQKGAIPYLFRLADAARTIGPDDARALQTLIDAGSPPATPPCQVVIGGPIGSGRTPMAAGIGTEFAFRKNKVRYLGLDALLEFAAIASGHPYPDDAGPTTINYWPWSEAQVVIIDDVGPLIAANQPAQEASLSHFAAILENELKGLAGVLSQCHTVWVIGDLRPPYEKGTLTATLDALAKIVGKYCSNRHPVIVVELASPPAPQRGKPLAAAVSNVRRVGQAGSP
jgi:hypothetical protein